ncbi:MAG: hypothetical protein J0I65_07515 [Variovorax sp.]|nr:hypothetical protein [Variovorax sp.]
MATNLGSLTVALGLDAAEYTRGLDKAEKDAYNFGHSIGTGIRTAATAAASALTALGVSASGAVAGFNALIEGASKFADLSDKTGASAEALASFAVAAGTSGVSMDKVASATNALTRNLVGVNDESKAAGAALKALGIPLQEFKALKPEEQIERLSKTFAKFEDGAGKSAGAMALLGKSGADVLPFLKTLEEQGGRQVILTQAMIDQADAYADRQAKAKAELELYAQALATQAIPALTAFTGALTDTIKDMLGVGKGASDLKNNTAVADFADGAVRALAFIVDAGDGVVRTFQLIGTTIGAAAAAAVAAGSGEFAQAKNIIQEGVKDVKGILDRELFSTKLDRRLADGKAAAAAAASAAPSARPSLKFNGPTRSSGGRADDPTKKLLDNQLKEYQRAIKQEEELLRDRNRTLDLYYGENLISIEGYYMARAGAASEATQKEGALIREQIAALEKYKASAKKDTERADAQGKINALLDEEAKLQRQAGQAALEESFKKARAQRDYKDALDQVRASLLEMQGDSGAATAIRTEIQYRDLLSRAIANNDAEGKKLIETLKQQSVYQAQFQQASTELGRGNAYLQIEEERIQRNRQLGASSELDSLIQLRDARQAAIGPLKETAAQLQRIAEMSGNPALVLQAKQAQAALEGLQATADPLAQKFDSIFSDAFGNAFADFVTGAKSAKEAFTSFANSVISQLAKMAAEKVAKDIFGGLFGGGGGSGGGASGLGSLFSSLFGGARAGGGPVEANKLYRVNERGPELLNLNGRQFLMMGDQAGSVTPNNRLGSGGGYAPVYNFNFSERIDRSTRDQVAMRVRRESNLAASRFGR